MALLEKIPAKISPLTFDVLVAQIRRTLEEGRVRAQKAVDVERARTYWEAGKWIHYYKLKGKDRAKYGDGLFETLAENIGVARSLVQDMHLFYQAYPIRQAPDELPWTHYQWLLRVKDKKQRDLLTKQAVEKNWASRELKAAVQKIQRKALETKSKDPAAGFKLIPRKGKFFTYSIVRPQNMHEGAGGFSLDLGFKARREIDFSGIRNPKPGEIVQIIRVKKDPAGDRYKIVRGNFKPSDLYTYKAKAQIFYDADTFWVDVDQGFRNWTEQKLRMRGIDAAELTEEVGKKAAAYVKKVISAVSFIVIKISGRDKFGRPLADVFYLEGADDRDKVLAEGKFLNQELLDLGLAGRME
ncbi:MAG: thermonuclease family protein [Candidatus Omnitrophica bacterium]|nr:thermonuclease family protein [Candidatus Omnitrophota bacterium]